MEGKMELTLHANTHCTSENPSTTINSPCSGFSSLWSPHPAALPELYPLLALLALVGPMHNLASQQGVDLVSAYLVLQLLHCVGGDAPVVVTNVTIHLQSAGISFRLGHRINTHGQCTHAQVHPARCVYRVKFPGQRQANVAAAGFGCPRALLKHCPRASAWTPRTPRWGWSSSPDAVQDLVGHLHLTKPRELHLIPREEVLLFVDHNLWTFFDSKD